MTVLLPVALLILSIYALPQLVPRTPAVNVSPAPPFDLTEQVHFGGAIAQGTFVRRTSGVGLQAVDVGFRPRALVLWWERVDNANGFLNHSAGVGLVGLGTGSNYLNTTTSSAIAWSDANGQSTTHSSRVGYPLAAIVILAPNGLGAYDGVASMKNWTSTGFTLNWTTNPSPAQATVISYIAFGGITNARVVEYTYGPVCGDLALTMPFSATSGFFISSGQPSGSSVSTNALMAFGAADSSANNIGLGFVAQSGVSPSRVKSITNTSVITFFNDPSGLFPPNQGYPHFLSAMRVTGFVGTAMSVHVDSPGHSGIACTGPGGGPGGGATPFWTLLIKGASLSVGTARKPSATGLQKVPLSFSPAAAMLMSTWSNVTPGNVNRGDGLGEVSIGGAAQAPNSTISQVGAWGSSKNVSNPSDTRMRVLQNNSLVRMNQSSGNYSFLASYASPSGNNLTLQWSLMTNASTPYFGYVAVGAPPPILSRVYRNPAYGFVTEGQSIDAGANYSHGANLPPQAINVTFEIPGCTEVGCFPIRNATTFTFNLSANNSYANYTDGRSYHYLVPTGSAGVCANSTQYTIAVAASDGVNRVQTPLPGVYIWNDPPEISPQPPSRTHVYKGQYYRFTFSAVDAGMPNCEGASWSLAGNSTSWLNVGASNGTVWGLSSTGDGGKWFWVNLTVTEVLPTPNPYPPASGTYSYQVYVDNEAVPQLTQLALNGVTGPRTQPFNVTVNYSSPLGNPPTSITLNASTFPLPATNGTALPSNSYSNYTVGRTYYRVMAPNSFCPSMVFVTAWANDGSFGAVESGFIFGVENSLPNITNWDTGGTLTVLGNHLLTHDFNASDADVSACQTLTWSMGIQGGGSLPSWLHIGSANGTVWGLAPQSTQSIPVTVSVDDGFDIGGDPDDWTNFTIQVYQVSTNPLNRFLNVDGVGCSGFLSSQVQCWSNVSGGQGGASIPTYSNPTFIDANSGWNPGVAISISENMSMASLTVSSWPSPLVLAGNVLPQVRVTIAGDLVVNTAMPIVILKAGAPSGPLAVPDVLQVNGTTVLNAGSSIVCSSFGNGNFPCDVRLRGNVYISTSSYLIMNGTWAFSGNLINNSTSPAFFVGPEADVTFDKSASLQNIGGTGSKNSFRTVILAGGDKQVSSAFGSSRLFSNDTAKTVTVLSSTTWTVSASGIINGASGKLLTLRSETQGLSWQLVSLGADNTTHASYVSVRDSNASGGGSIAASNSVDDGNNDNWFFGAGGPGPGPGLGTLPFGIGAITDFLASTLGIILVFVIMVSVITGAVAILFGRIGSTLEGSGAAIREGWMEGFWERIRRR
jgi:hypothetical protein